MPLPWSWISQERATLSNCKVGGWSYLLLVWHPRSQIYFNPILLAMYIENLSHRKCWFKLFVTFDLANHTTTSLLNNLLPKERDYIQA